MLCELNGVSSSDVRLVVVISGDDGVGQLFVCSIVMFGMFCDVIVIMNSGMLMLMIDVIENVGIVNMGCVSVMWKWLKLSRLRLLVMVVLMISVVGIVQCGVRCLMIRQVKNIVSISVVWNCVVWKILMLILNRMFVSSVVVMLVGMCFISVLNSLFMLMVVSSSVYMMNVLIVLGQGMLGSDVISSVVLGVDYVIMMGV